MARFDAIVLGAGPSGTASAYFLCKAGWKVAIVERTAFPRRKVCGEFISMATHPLLAAMGLDPNFSDDSGPEVHRVGLFAGKEALEAPMPSLAGWGRTVSRASLDERMLLAAAHAGVEVYQPFRADRVSRMDSGYCCQITSGGEQRELFAGVIIAAHGSWYPGGLDTQLPHTKVPSDLLAFKFVFENTSLDSGLMPLIAFPGGYGGLVHMGGGQVGLSCCIRRDMLQDRRAFYKSPTAAEATIRHIRATVQAVDDVLAGAAEPELRLAAGPIHPGVRVRSESGVFKVGNAAGEAHPVIAEGISMAIQSGYLLAKTLSTVDASVANATYERAWRATFVQRISVARIVAELAMTRTGTGIMCRSVKLIPRLLTFGATLSGKANASSSV